MSASPKRRRARPFQDEPLTYRRSGRNRLRVRYAAFGFLPGAGAGTYPDTRHCHASIVLVPS